MKIWFDLSNSPHINLFYDLIHDLKNEGHEIIITCRPLANTIDLLEQKKLKYKVVGRHYGKNILKKLFGYPVRVLQLRNFLKKQKPDLAVSQSSFHSPLVAWLLRIPSIYTNDNEHAMGNILCFIFAKKILIPENLSVKNILKQGASKKKIIQYPGVKEGIYLWRIGEKISNTRNQKQISEIKIYIRPEPLTAQYYKGGLNFLDTVLLELQHKYSFTILPRDEVQMAHYSQEKFSSINVPAKPLPFSNIAADCTLFIGAGGSMTRELAVLGIPTISVYQDELLDVDKYLISKHLMYYDKEITVSKLEKYIAGIKNATPDFELLEKGKQAYSLFKNEILKFNRA
jgi:predicted glycosyltransferase